MTKTTLKAIWFGGGGVIATWLAVTPNPNAPAAAPTPEAQRVAATTQLNADNLRAQADRLRERSDAAAMRPPTRNPFRFSAPKSTTPKRVPDVAAPLAMLAAAPAAPPAPTLKLDGVAEKTLSGGVSRTAIISGDGQIYLVRDGDSIAGRYTVAAVEPEAVVLRDAAGVELRLTLPNR